TQSRLHQAGEPAIKEPLSIHESLRPSEAGPRAVHLRTGAPLGRNGSHRQLPASWLRGDAFWAEGCRARLSPAREGDRELWHKPRKGGENIALPGLLTQGGGRHRPLLCEEHAQVFSRHLLRWVAPATLVGAERTAGERVASPAHRRGPQMNSGLQKQTLNHKTDGMRRCSASLLILSTRL